jgi:hypothetical protein
VKSSVTKVRENVNEQTIYGIFESAQSENRTIEICRSQEPGVVSNFLKFQWLQLPVVVTILVLGPPNQRLQNGPKPFSSKAIAQTNVTQILMQWPSFAVKCGLSKVAIFGEFTVTVVRIFFEIKLNPSVTIMCRNDELSFMMG